MSVVPAESFNFQESGVQVGPRFFVVGPLSPGCILRRVWVQVNNTAALAVRLRWAFALGGSETAAAEEFAAGYLPLFGNAEGVVIAGKLPYSANVVEDVPQYFTHYIGRRIVSGAAWIIVALGADSSDGGWFWASFEVVGVLDRPGVGPGGVARSG